MADIIADAPLGFLDTNVLVYTFDAGAAAKRAIARDLVSRALAEGAAVTSTQVVREFLNVATVRFPEPMDEARASRYLSEVLAPLCTVFASVELYERALGIRERWRFSWHDALIVAGALEAGARLLYTEDLQHGQRIETLTVHDPFAAGDAVHKWGGDR